MAYELFFSWPRPKTKGVFVEFGAEDGVKVSNTLFFEKYLGWTGLLIEPSTSCCEKLRRYRSAAVSEHGVCTDDSVFKEVFSCNGQAQKTPATCRELGPLLAQHDITHVNFLSIDCEGCELVALKTLPLAAPLDLGRGAAGTQNKDNPAADVDVIVMEWRPEDGDARKEYLQQFGFESARVPFYEVGRVGRVTDEFFWHTGRVAPFSGK